jgi:hypothetical protein
MSRRFNLFSMARSPYNKRRRALLRGVMAIRRVAQALTNKGKKNKEEKKKSPVFTKVQIAYKHKVERLLLVDEVNRVGLPPRGKKDWYKRLKTRDTP